jgi:hypothetical protein
MHDDLSESGMRRELREDIRDLHQKTNRIETNVANLNGRLEVVLPRIATVPEIEKIINDAVDRHSRECWKRTPKSISIPPTTQTDKKTIAGLIGVVSILAAALSAVIDKIVDMI